VRNNMVSAGNYKKANKYLWQRKLDRSQIVKSTICQAKKPGFYSKGIGNILGL